MYLPFSGKLVNLISNKENNIKRNNNTAIGYGKSICTTSIYIRMMQKHDCNIFNNMQKTDFREFRNLIIEMVLHTDMSQHFTQLKAMKNLLQQQNEHRFVISCSLSKNNR